MERECREINELSVISAKNCVKQIKNQEFKVILARVGQELHFSESSVSTLNFLAAQTKQSSL